MSESDMVYLVVKKIAGQGHNDADFSFVVGYATTRDEADQYVKNTVAEWEKKHLGYATDFECKIVPVKRLTGNQ